VEILRIVIGPHRQVVITQDKGRVRLTDGQAELIREFVLELLRQE